MTLERDIPVQSKAVQDYLKAIFTVHEREGRVTTSSLASRLGVSPASVTGMVKKLAEMDLVSHEPYQSVALTEPGRRVALEMIRHHRLVETYLVKQMGISWDKVHEEAERLEHVISEDLEDRMDEMLGHPTHDPHGAPIPTRDGRVPEVSDLRLGELCCGECGTISQVADHDAEMLRYVAERGLFPGVAVTVARIEPYGGPMVIRVGASEFALGWELAEAITVHRTGPEEVGHQ